VSVLLQGAVAQDFGSRNPGSGFRKDYWSGRGGDVRAAGHVCIISLCRGYAFGLPIISGGSNVCISCYPLILSSARSPPTPFAALNAPATFLPRSPLALRAPSASSLCALPGPCLACPDQTRKTSPWTVFNVIRLLSSIG
jgi:hypothetical protein